MKIKFQPIQTRRQIIIDGSALFGFAVSGLVPGCGGGSGTTSSTSPGTSTTSAPAPAPATLKLPPLSGTNIPILRGTTIDAHADWLNKQSTRWSNVSFLPTNGCNAIHLILSPFDMVTGATLLPGQPLSARVLDSYNQFATLLVPWALSQNMYVILTINLDTAGYPIQNSWPDNNGSYWTNASSQAELIAAWVAIAEQFKGQAGLIFDFINEPHGLTASDVSNNHAIPKSVWASLYPQILTAVQAVYSNRWVIIEPIWGDSQNFASLPPVSNNKVIYSFHGFRPHYFTEQSIPAASPYPLGGTVTYPGITQDSTFDSPQNWTKSVLQAQDYTPASNFKNLNNVRVMLGDTGCNLSAPAQSRQQYTADVLEIATSNSFDIIYFEYEGWGVPSNYQYGWSFENSNIQSLIVSLFQSNLVSSP